MFRSCARPEMPRDAEWNAHTAVARLSDAPLGASRAAGEAAPRPVTQGAAGAGYSTSTVTASRNGIIARNRAPTASMGCCCSACRVAVNRGRPALSSAIHALA